MAIISLLRDLYAHMSVFVCVCFFFLIVLHSSDLQTKQKHEKKEQVVFSRQSKGLICVSLFHAFCLSK